MLNKNIIALIALPVMFQISARAADAVCLAGSTQYRQAADLRKEAFAVKTSSQPYNLRFPKELEIIDREITACPSPSAFGYRGTILMERGLYDDARQAFADAIRLAELNRKEFEPSLPSYYHKMGLASVQEEDFDPAITYFTSALDISSGTYGIALYDRASAFIFKGDFTAGAADLDNFFRDNPMLKTELASVPCRLLQTAGTPALSCSTAPATVPDYRKEADAIAESLMSDAKNKNASEMANVFYLKALELTQKDKKEKTAEYLMDILISRYPFQDSFARRGLILRKPGTYRIAEENFSRALEFRDSKDPSVRAGLFRLRGECRYETGRIKEAMEDFEVSAKTYPKDAGFVLFDQWRALFLTGRYKEAAEKLAALVTLKSAPAAILGKDAMEQTCLAMKNAGEDVKECEMIKNAAYFTDASTPDFNTLSEHIDREALARKAGRRQKAALYRNAAKDMADRQNNPKAADNALKLLGKAIELAPVANDYHMKGVIEFDKNMLEAAEKDFTEFIRLSAKDSVRLSEGYRLRGIIRTLRGKDNDSVADFSKSIDINPEHAVYSYYERAQVYLKLKQFDKAAKDAELFVAAKDQNDPAEKKQYLSLLCGRLEHTGTKSPACAGLPQEDKNRFFDINAPVIKAEPKQPAADKK